MIEFNDSFSQAAVAEALRAHESLQEIVNRNLMVRGWEYDYDETVKRTSPPHIKPVPTMHKTTLYVNPSDMRDNLPREIGFAWWERQCNEHGYPVGEWKRTIVGAYFNHDTNEQPNWGSHT